MKAKRAYTMGARAQTVQDTRTRIREALFELGTTQVFSQISLEAVAQEAGVSVQTILRHFGSRAGLVESNIQYALDRVSQERFAPEGDVDTAISVLMDHYELRGDTAMLMLSQERSDEQVRLLTDHGRAMHRGWVRDAFASVVTDGEDVLDLLVVATDVYTWKLLRRDRGHSRATTEKQMKALVRAVIRDAGKRD